MHVICKVHVRHGTRPVVYVVYIIYERAIAKRAHSLDNYIDTRDTLASPAHIAVESDVYTYKVRHAPSEVGL